MKNRVRRVLPAIFLSAAMCFASAAAASELVFTWKNPSFGGNPMNGQWMLNQAEMQNNFKDPNAEDGLQQNTLQSFKESLLRQVLSRISQKIVDDAFGTGDLTEGHYEIGGYVIDVTYDTEFINVTIFDPATSDTTTIQVPYY